MRQDPYRQNLKNRHAGLKAENFNPIESITYELKPYVLIGIATLSLHYIDPHWNLAKLSVLLLYMTSGYILYSRLVHRGYIK
jgi:hypothetical protein